MKTYFGICEINTRWYTDNRMKRTQKKNERKGNVLKKVSS